MIKTDYSEFNKWHLRTFSHLALLCEENDVQEWFERVEARHQDLREKLGGVSYNKIIEIQPPEQEIQAPVDVVNPICKKMYSLIPAFFGVYGWNWSQLSRPKFTDISKNQSVSTVISNWMQKNLSTEDPIDLMKAKQIKDMLCELGRIWKSSKLKKCKMGFFLSTHPAYFESIARFGVDGGSCYRCGGENETHKYVLANSPNTFVGLIYNPDKYTPQEMPDSSKEGIITRFWGYSEPPFNAFYTANMYPKNPPDGGSVQLAIEEGFRSILGSIYTKNDWFLPKLVYFNKDSVVYYDCKKTAEDSIEGKSPPRTVEMDDSGMRWMRKCKHCQKFTTDRTVLWNQIDDEFYCQKCQPSGNFYTCGLTGRHTFQSLMPFRDHDFKELKIHPNVAIKHYFTACGYYVNKEDLAIIEDHHTMHIVQAKQNGYNKCQRCELWTKNPELCFKCQQMPKPKESKKNEITTDKVVFSSLQYSTFIDDEVRRR